MAEQKGDKQLWVKVKKMQGKLFKLYFKNYKFQLQGTLQSLQGMP